MGYLTSRFFTALLTCAAVVVPELAVAAPLPAAIAGTVFISGAGTSLLVTLVPIIGKAIFSTVLQAVLSPTKTPRYAGTQVNVVESAVAAPIIYGTVKMGGVVFYQQVPGFPKVYLHRLIALCCHEINGIVSYHIDDEDLTLNESNIVSGGKYSGLIRIISHNGADDQTVDETLLNESENLWTSRHRAVGTAYIYARFKFDLDKFVSGAPSLLAVIEGKKLYDPRTGSTAFSSNSALCLRDYLLFSGIADEDELDDSSFSAAANICDEDVTLAAGGTEKRYSCDGFFPTDKAPMETINAIVQSMAGSLWYSQGQWVCKAGAYIEPVLSLDEDDARSAMQIVTRTSRRDLYNRVIGVFRGAQSNWQLDNYPPVESQTFLADDGGQTSEIEINLPFTSSPSRAQRIAKVFLYRQREQMLITGNFGMRAAQLTPGDTVQLTNTRLGFTDKTFEVVEWGFALADEGDIVVPLTLQEISAGVYDWDADETAFETANTVLLPPDFVSAVGVNISEEERVVNENLVNVLIATVTASADASLNIDFVEVQFRIDGETQWRAMGSGELVISGTLATAVFEVLSVSVGSYDVRARAINGVGVRGDWLLQSAYLQGSLDQPSDVSGLGGAIDGGSIHLEWDASTDPSLSHYVVRHAHESTGADYANAITIAAKVSRPATSLTLPAIHGTYMVKPYSKNGIASSGFASITVPEADVLTYQHTTEVAEAPTFAGTKTGCSVVSSRLVITDTTTAPSSATYEFATAIDVNQVRLVHSHIHVQTIRSLGAGAGLWDGISGSWDDWPGNWDEWTASLQLSDTDVVFYIATTDDDPNASPTWSAWRKFRAGDFSGRGFKFKVVLHSSSVGVTPSLDLLEAFVGY